MPARRGRDDAATMIEQIVAIARDPEGHKQRLAEFEQRQEAAVEAEAAASARIEEADRREAEADKRKAEIADLETGLQAHQALIDKCVKFKAYVAEAVLEMQAEEAKEQE